MTLEICLHADDHKAAIWNLFQFYCYETSIEDECDVEDSGLYSLSAAYFSQYWTDPRWSAHLLRWNGVIAGFALIEISDAMQDAQELADLFVFKRYRRRGIAREVALHFMAQRTVSWTVVVYDEAKEARSFWDAMFRESLLQPTRQVADPDDRAVTVHVLEPNRFATQPS